MVFKYVCKCLKSSNDGSDDTSPFAVIIAHYATLHFRVLTTDKILEQNVTNINSKGRRIQQDELFV